MRFLIFLILLVPAAGLAQPPRSFFPWWEGRMVRDLNLSEDQTRQIQNVLRDSRTSMIDMRAALEKAEAELEDLFNEDYVDQRRASDAIDKLVQARSDMTRAFSQLSLKLRAVLTPQQWRELQRRRREMGPPWRERREGEPERGQGPRGPGPRRPRPQ